MTPDRVVGCLKAGTDDALIDEPETEALDFKEQPYLLDTDKGRWELAKDVAALANSGGGCLVIGVATRVPADREEEVASEIKPFPASMVNVHQMRSTLDAAHGVYPVLKGVEIERFPRQSDKAIAVVRVPPQDEDDLPFMVVRMVEGDEKRGVGIGVPLRSGPHTYWLPPGQLHRDLSDGRRSRITPVSSLDASPSPAATAKTIRDRIEQQFQTIEQYMGWGEAPTLMLAAIPSQPQQVPIDGLYDSARIRGCIQSPPEIRHAGFGLARYSEPENVDGALVNATAKRQILWVDTDGAAFAAAVGLQSFLTRSGGTRVAQAPEPRVINPTVLVEWTYLFFKFVHECIKQSITGTIQAGVRLQGPRSRPWQLRMVGGLPDTLWHESNQAGPDDFSTDFTLTDTPEQDAFTALRRIYNVFGLGGDEIPYTNNEQVDPSMIQAIG